MSRFTFEDELAEREQEIDSGGERTVADLEKTIIVATKALIETLYKVRY